MKVDTYNVLGFDDPLPCFTCGAPTKLFVIEYDQPLCIDCIMILSAVIVASEEITAGRTALENERRDFEKGFLN